MKTLNEWLQEKNITELSSDGFGMMNYFDEALAESQLGMMTDRVLGLLDNASPEQKRKLIEKFIMNVKSRI